MQNDTAVIRTANFTHAFYRSGEGIFGKSNGERIELINNDVSDMSVGVGKNGFPVIFHKNGRGNCFLTSIGAGGQTETRMLSPSAAFSEADYCVYCQGENTGAWFVYANKTGDRGIFAEEYAAGKNSLMKLGGFEPMKKAPFYVFGNNSPILFSRNGAMLNLFIFSGWNRYSKVTVSNKGAFITDISCVEYGGRLHIAYIIEENHICSLMYKYVENGLISAPRVLFNCKGAGACVSFASQGNIFIFAVCKNKGIYVFSGDNGVNFSTASRFFKPVDYICKAKFISEGENALEVLIDSHYNPLIIDDFAPGRADVFRSQYDRLKKKIVSYENDIRDNTDKVKEISDAFAKTQQENDKILYSWRVRLEESETELHAAQEREAEAVQRCVRLESENVRLKGEVQALIEESRKYKEQYEQALEISEQSARIAEENETLKRAKKILEEDLYRINNSDNYDFEE